MHQDDQSTWSRQAQGHTNLDSPLVGALSADANHRRMAILLHIYQVPNPPLAC